LRLMYVAFMANRLTSWWPNWTGGEKTLASVKAVNPKMQMRTAKEIKHICSAAQSRKVCLPVASHRFQALLTSCHRRSLRSTTTLIDGEKWDF
jgi:hypothetical protein